MTDFSKISRPIVGLDDAFGARAKALRSLQQKLAAKEGDIIEIAKEAPISYPYIPVF